jgi:hypothetical protein
MRPDRRAQPPRPKLPLALDPPRAEPYAPRDHWPREEAYGTEIRATANALGLAARLAVLKYAEVKAAVGGVTAIQGAAAPDRVAGGRGGAGAAGGPPGGRAVYTAQDVAQWVAQTFGAQYRPKGVDSPLRRLRCRKHAPGR